MLEVLQAGGAGEPPVLLLLLLGIFSLQPLKFAASLSVENGSVRRCWLSCLLEGDREQEGSTHTHSGLWELLLILEAAGRWGMHQNTCGAGFAFLPTNPVLPHPIPACQPGCWGAPCAHPKAQN